MALGTSGVQQRYSDEIIFLAIAHLDAPLVKDCHRDTEQATREAAEYLGPMCRRLLEELALGSSPIYKHSLRACVAERSMVKIGQ